eukprot:14573596-Ditylum_brightwellii.AAC.1
MRPMATLVQDEDILIMNAGGRKHSITTSSALNMFGETIHFKEIKEQDKRKKGLCGGGSGIFIEMGGGNMSIKISKQEEGDLEDI